MKIDCHTHGKLAKKLPFSIPYTEWLFERARHAGLDAICLTEHFNTLGFEEIYEYLDRTYECVGDGYQVGELFVFPGMEVDIIEGGHILVIGNKDEIIRLNHDLEDYKEKMHFISFTGLMNQLEGASLIVGAAHPFRLGRGIPYLEEQELKRLDFIDLNGKDVAHKGEEASREIEEFSKRIQLPVLAGSDTHQAIQYGCIYNQFSKTCYTISELKKIISKSEYTIQIAPSIEVQVEAAGLIKRSLKEIHQLGGDYVTVLLE